MLATNYISGGCKCHHYVWLFAFDKKVIDLTSAIISCDVHSFWWPSSFIWLKLHFWSQEIWTDWQRSSKIATAFFKSVAIVSKIPKPISWTSWSLGHSRLGLDRVDRRAFKQFGWLHICGFFPKLRFTPPALSWEDIPLKKVRINRDRQTDRLTS